MGIRSVLIILLLLALAKPGLTWSINNVSTVYLIDASDSMKESKKEAESFVKEALELMKEKDMAGVIIFGGDPVMESFLSKEPSFASIKGIVESKYTNIEKALTTAISILPDKSKKRIVLITDGEENEGDSSKAAGILKDKGIDFKVCKIEKDRGDELAITGISVPNKINKGEEYNIVVNIKSNFNINGKLTLFDGNEKAAEEKVMISKGENRFVFSDKSDTTGFKTYKAVIEAEGDKDNRNNEGSAIINVLDEPQILLIEGNGGEGDEIAKMLEASKAYYKRVEAASAPSSLQAMVQYKTIILANVSAEKLNRGFMSSLEPYVKDFGGGLVATGGEDSFALGGYYKTPLEKVLPVNMELKGKKAIPDMSIILVIDKSGSMSDGRDGISRIDLAREAASRVLDSLREQDSIGVLAFDDAMYWVVSPQKIIDREETRNKIGTIRAGGGTSILPPLKEAVKTAKSIKSKIKHVILLTDGQAEKTGYDSVLEEAEKAGVTVSAVAVGQDADASLLQHIAGKAGGRFYKTDEYSNLPTIFAKETFMAAKSYLNNRSFTPRIISLHPIIADASAGGLPDLLGYVAASPKDTARVVLESDEEDPILTLWQYGLGKTAAWNSDMSGKWSANYVNWEKNLALWNNIINWTIESYEDDELNIESHIEGGFAVIKVKQNDNKVEYDTQAIITTPSLKNIELKLEAESPGQYKGSYRLDEVGSYLIKIVQRAQGEIKRSSSTGLAVSYSPEYAIEAKSDILDRTVKESGGKYIKNASEVYEGNMMDVKGRKDLTPFLLFTSLFVLLLDIAARRLSIPYDRLIKVYNKAVKKVKIKNKEAKMEIKEETFNNKENIKVDTIDESLYNNKVDEAGKTKADIKDIKANKSEKEMLDTTALLKRKNR